MALPDQILGEEMIMTASRPPSASRVQAPIDKSGRGKRIWSDTSSPSALVGAHHRVSNSSPRVETRNPRRPEKYEAGALLYATMDFNLYSVGTPC